MTIQDFKVVLVSPDQTHLSDPRRAEPLGLMYLEGVLHDLGIEVSMVDLSFTSDIPKADVYGFSSSTVNFLQTVRYAEQVKPAYTIIGGSHVSAVPKDALKSFDAVVTGPGELALLDVLEDFQKGIKGRIYKKHIADIDSIPIPPRFIWNRICYNSFEDENATASIITSRGCPFSCSFCASNAIWGRHVSFRSVENVMQEIQYLKDTYGIQSFKFVDDIFTLDKSRFRIFSKELSTLNIKWFCETRVDSIDDVILDQMVASGCTTINLGVESVCDNVLIKIQKKQTILMVKEAIKKIHSKGLKVKVYLIYGLPFESADIVSRTKEFITDTNPDYVSLFTFTPYPGTDVWNNPSKYGIKNIDCNFEKYQHSVGAKIEERSWLSSIEYYDRTKEKMRVERNDLKRFTMNWNESKRKNHA